MRQIKNSGQGQGLQRAALTRTCREKCCPYVIALHGKQGKEKRKEERGKSRQKARNTAELGNSTLVTIPKAMSRGDKCHRSSHLLPQHLLSPHCFFFSLHLILKAVQPLSWLNIWCRGIDPLVTKLFSVSHSLVLSTIFYFSWKKLILNITYSYHFF